MTIQEAIEKAIKGGYTPIEDSGNEYKILLDPEFWQCLGKEMGWKNNYYQIVRSPCNDMPGRYAWTGPQYIYEMHCFIDHLADGKSIESYFTNL